MYAAFPRSDYYGGSAPPRTVRPTVGPARISAPDARPAAGPGRFPCSLVIACRSRRPAIPRRHRHDYAAVLHRGLARQRTRPPHKSPARADGRRAPHPAQIRQVRAGGNSLRGFTHRFLSYTSPSCSPGTRPSDGPGPAPALSGLLPALPGTSRIRLPSASIPLLRQGIGAGLSPPLDQQAPHGALLRWQTRVG
jgi:hypothetical protein